MKIRTATALSLALSAGLVDPATTVAQEPTEVALYEGEFELRAGGELMVAVGDMDIDISTRPGATGTVRVIARSPDMAWAREWFGRMRFEASASGGDLELRTREENLDWREWRRDRWASYRAEVVIPARYDMELATGDGDIAIETFEGRLRAQTGDGDVSIEGVGGGAIEIRTGDGDITMGRVRGSTIRVRTGDGDVVAEAMSAEEIELGTGDGDLTIDGVSGAISASAGDGDIVLEILDFDGVSVRTGDGDVWLAMDPDVAADVDIEGEDVDLGRAMRLEGTVRERRIAGTLNGGGPLLRIRTGDGSITLRSR